MKPGKRLLQWGMAIGIYALIVSLLSPLGKVIGWSINAGMLLQLESIWQIGIGAFLCISTWDFWKAWPSPPLEIRRSVPNSIALGNWTSVELQFHHNFSEPIEFSVFDQYPVDVQMKGLPCDVPLHSGQISKLSYQIRATERGDVTFQGTQILLNSPLKLWQRRLVMGAPQTVKVYPNFAAIRQYILLTTSHHTNKIGIVQTRRRGEGTEFDQLREYRQSDTLKQIDWKASARRKKLISKEFREETNQQLLFLLDCSRRMRSRDEELSHFDHSLNALLLLSHIALGQGDAVSLMSFGGERQVWLPPQKGATSVNTILNAVYNLQASSYGADYRSMSETLMQRHHKHSLIILLSNVRDEDTQELIDVFGIFKKRHRVLLASLRETILDDTIDTPVQNFEQALRYTATKDFLLKRQNAHNALREVGIALVDTLPQNLPVALANAYYQLKRSGRL